MSAPAWFNYETYVSNKLAQLQATEPDAGWTAESLQAAFTANGYSNDADGMYRHFVDFGNAENVSPSPWFVASEYMANKLAQMQAAEPDAGWDMAKLEQAFKDAGLSAWDHYEQFGQAEGISPSSLFDTSAYLEAKLAQLQATEPDAGWKTVDQVVKAFQENGLNPIEHYVLFGVNENLSYSPVMPEPPVTDELTTARDVLNLGAGDQIIGGVASALSAEKTLNENDLIDGGEGNDTLRVTLDANFNGFTVTDDPNTTGGMKNVENVELTNNGSIARTFSAKGSEGVTTYTLHAGEAGTGAINLKDLSAAGVTVNVDGLQKGSTDVQFASGALSGAEDSMTFGLNNVGAAAASATADPTYVKLSATTGLESVTVNASGTNYANLEGLDAASLAVTGAGSLDVSAVNAALTSLDASAATGNVTADLSAATMQTVKGGAGDDTFTVKGLAPTAVLEGGAGNDTLIISKSGAATLQPTVSGFEAIGIKDNTGAITLSAKNAQDFTTLLLENTDSNKVTVANLSGSSFTVESLGTEKGAATTNTAVIADAVDLTVNVNAGDDAEKAQTVTTDITAASATNAVINVGANVTENGVLSFDAAQSVQLNVASNKVNDAELTSFEGTINAAKAQSLEVNAEGALGGTGATFNAASASSVIINAAQGGTAALNAAAATDVNLTFGDDMTLTGKLDKAQQVSINQTDGKLTATGVTLSGLYSLNVSGAGTESAVEFKDLGTASTAYDLNVTASGLAANEGVGFTAANIASGGNISLDFSQMTGDVSITGTVTGAGVTIATSELADTMITGLITANTGDIELNALGNLGNITLTGGATATAGNINLAFDGAATISTGALTADKGSITLDASAYLGEVNGGGSLTTGAIKAQSVTIKGSELMANDFATTAIDTTNLTFSSGLGDDKVKLESSDAKATAISADVQTGAGNDTVTIDVTANVAATTITVTGDMGGQDTDTLALSGISGTTAALTTIDLSGLSGYTVNDLDYDTLKTATSLTDVKLGGGVDTITLGTTGTGNTQITFDGFTAGANGDKLDISGVTAVGSFKGSYANTGELQMLDSISSASVVDNGTYYYEGSLSSITAADSSFAGNIFVAWLDGDKLSVAEVSFTTGTGAVTAVADVQLSGIEGTFSMDNFILS